MSEFTPMTYSAALYTAGYVRKKVEARDFPWIYDRVNPLTGEIVKVDPEFGVMSRRPGIGRTYLRAHWRDIYPRDFVTIEGREFKPPRYYDKWMEQDHRTRRVWNEKRKRWDTEPADPSCDCDAHRQIIHEVKEKRWEEREDVTEDQLVTQELSHRARLRFFKQRGAL